MSLLLQNVAITLDAKTIINQLSLKVATGSFVGVLGPNGSGKSTLLRAVYGLLKPSSGEIFLSGRNLKTISLAETAKQLGVVGQFNTIDFSLSVLDIVLLGRAPHKKWLEGDSKADYAIALSAIKKVGLEKYLHSDFTSLSGGEKQRVVLARALTQQPEILLLDEPTNHLDIKYQLQILSLVKSLNITVLAVLHDLNLAAMYCDSIYLLKQGTLAACGSPRQVLTAKIIKSVYDIDCFVQDDNRRKCLSISYYRPDLTGEEISFCR